MHPEIMRVESYRDPEPQEGSDLRQYWRVLSEYVWGLLGLLFVTGLVTTVYVHTLEPVYQATITLLIEATPARVVSIEEVYGISEADNKYYQTQYEILKSRTVASNVVDRLALWDQAEFDPTTKRVTRSPLKIPWRDYVPADWLPKPSGEAGLTDAQRREIAVDRFLNRVSVRPLRDSQLVRVSVESFEPELAAKMANALGDAYIESDLEARLQMTQKATSWLTDRMKGLRQKVEASERTVQAFRDREELVDAQGVQSLATGQMQVTSGSLVAARGARLRAENLFRQVQALKGQPVSRFESLPAVLGHPLVQNLKSIEATAQSKVAELRKRYGPQHPKMIAAVADRKEAKANLQVRIRTVVDGIQKAYEVAKANEESMLEAMEQAKREVQSVNRKQYELDSLEREVEANRELYDMFLVRFKETSASQDMRSALARVVDPAIVPRGSVKPRKKRTVLLALMIALAAGIVLAFLVDHLDNTIKDADDVQNKLAIPMLGQLPKLKTRGKDDDSPLRHFLEDAHSNFSEIMRTVRTGIALSGMDGSNKTVLVTSSMAGEGKSTVAMNLAFATGQMERVLLIDADMRRPSIGKVCKLPEDAMGLSQFVLGTATISECVHELKGTNTYVMPADVIPPNPLEMLSSSRFAQVIDKLGQAFDRVIIDSAPALAVSDALVLARFASIVVYVIRCDHTPFQAVRTGTQRLREFSSPTISVVLNQVVTRASAKYGKYGYYSPDYHSYYGHGKG